MLVLGPTASGKTKLAIALAKALNGAILSADSRQVYRHLNIGTGKDLKDYGTGENKLPYYLIDIVEPETQFFLHEYVEQLDLAFVEALQNKKLPIICGGTGQYLDAVRTDYSLTQVPEDASLRTKLKDLDKKQLLEILFSYPETLRQQVDQHSTKRIIRGIEIAHYQLQKPIETIGVRPEYHPFYIGIKTEVEERRKKIQDRLLQRMEEGLVQEAESLLAQGMTHERLQKLGLEYKFLSYYLIGKISKLEMLELLQIAIQQYAKRQMTWFRKMEKEGIHIHWLDRAELSEDLLREIKQGLFA